MDDEEFGKVLKILVLDTFLAFFQYFKYFLTNHADKTNWG